MSRVLTEFQNREIRGNFKQKVLNDIVDVCRRYGAVVEHCFCPFALYIKKRRPWPYGYRGVATIDGFWSNPLSVSSFSETKEQDLPLLLELERMLPQIQREWEKINGSRCSRCRFLNPPEWSVCNHCGAPHLENGKN